MPTREELLIEANRRGLLTDERKQLFDEAVRRGVISEPVPQQNVPGLAPLAPVLPLNVATVGQNIAAANPTGIGGFALRQFIDNILSTPRAAGTLLADAAAATRTAAGSVPRLFNDQPLELGRRFTEAREEERQLQPARFLRDLPVPDTFDIQAAARTAVGRGEGSIPARFVGQRDELIEADLQARQDRPVASVAGDVLGDVATLVTGRAPLARAARDRRFAARANPVDKAVEATTPPKGLEALRQTADDVVQSKLVQSLKRGGIRIAETGLEGAVIGALNDDDPLTSGAMAAGAQTAGSALLSISEGVLGRRGRNLVMAAAATTSFIQLFKSATPGDRDRILESTESAFNKIAATLVLGGLAGAAGMGRVGGRLPDRLPAFADAVTSIPRGSVVSLLSEIGQGDADAQLIEDVLLRLAEDPEFFGPTAARRIERALFSDSLSVAETINDLRANREFRRRLDEL